MEETTTENYESSERSAKRWGEEKCEACKFDYFEKEEIIKHKIENHRIYLCLQCDQMIADKNIMINTNFDMRDLVRKDFEASGIKMTSEQLAHYVKE